MRLTPHFSVDLVTFTEKILNGKLLSCASLKSDWPRSSQKVTNFYEGYTYRSYSFNCWMNTGYSYSKLSFSYPCWCWTRMWKCLKLWPLTNLIACLFYFTKKIIVLFKTCYRQSKVTRLIQAVPMWFLHFQMKFAVFVQLLL